MKTSLTPEALKSIQDPLKTGNQKFNLANPGETGRRQPVHTVYGGAQIFSADTAQKLGVVALKSLEKFAPDAKSFSHALALPDVISGEGLKLWNLVYDRVTEKLKREAVEDFRIDFEDGYGVRPDIEEDGHAESAALEVYRGMEEGTLPPFIGIRIKPFNEANSQRSFRTLDIFLSTLFAKAKGRLPENFVVTLPKVTNVEQTSALVQALALLEKTNGLKADTLKFELMIETPQSIIDLNGHNPIRAFVDAGKGRCVGAHFGTYDYTAGCGITADHQTMANPVCDFAKHMMQVSLAGTDVFLSDGATNIMPVGDVDSVHRAWKLSYDHIRHSLETGFYQGWDLHPAQLPVRYAAVYIFFLEGLKSSSQRLKGFIEKAAKATLMGDVFDDAATGQGLLNFFLRGISCGAITEIEARETGLSIDEIRSRSFLKILHGRKVV